MSAAPQTVDAALAALAPVTAQTVAERAMVASWLRLAGGSLDALSIAVADALRDAAEAIGESTQARHLHPWVEAGLMSQNVGTPLAASAAPWRRTPSSVRRWAVDAEPGAVLIYHVGHLGHDRQANPVLSATADYVAALDHIGAVRAITTKTALPSCALYLAQRRSGLAHNPVVMGQIAPMEFAALAALHDRPPNVAAGKHLERRIPCSAHVAEQVLDALVGGGLAERGRGRGVWLTERGLEVLGVERCARV